MHEKRLIGSANSLMDKDAAHRAMEKDRNPSPTAKKTTADSLEAKEDTDV